MQVKGEQMWTLLRALDDPDHLETPASYDFDATRAQFERLVQGLDATFDCQSEAGRSVQNASLHARVVVPAEATVTGERLVICVSNFGWLATVSVDNPGAYDSAELELLLDAEDATRVYAVLDALDYVVVPEGDLWRTYDGPSRFTLPGEDPRSTWWIRYFDYL